MHCAQVHIYGTPTTLTLLVTGVGMGIYAREYLGFSFHKAGRIHVLLGYVTCLLFLGGIVSNALRCGKKHRGTAFLHALESYYTIWHVRFLHFERGSRGQKS